MGTSDAVANHMTAITSSRSEVGPGTSGTIQTPGGPITWAREADGTLNAKGSGQQLTVIGTDDSDGSWQSSAVFSVAGGGPYLSIRAVAQNTERSTATTVEAGQSQLTLTITGINAAVTSGTATVSGTLNGSAVHWTGPVDLTSNPLTGTAVPGWPRGAFAAELQKASFFNPLANTLAPPPPKPVAFPPAGLTGTGFGHVTAHDAVGVIGHAVAWCEGGAIAGAGAGPETLGTSVLLGCAGGAAGSLLSDFYDWWTDPGPVVEPLPPIDFPIDPEPVGPITQTSTDDPPPSPPPDAEGQGGQPPSTGDPGQGGQPPSGSSDPGGASTGNAGSGSGDIDDDPSHQQA